MIAIAFSRSWWGFWDQDGLFKLLWWNFEAWFPKSKIKCNFLRSRGSSFSLGLLFQRLPHNFLWSSYFSRSWGFLTFLITVTWIFRLRTFYFYFSPISFSYAEFFHQYQGIFYFCPTFITFTKDQPHPLSRKNPPQKPLKNPSKTTSW